MLKNLDDVVAAAQMAGSYMITLTTLEGGKLNHSLIVNMFPDGDCLRAHACIKELIVEHLERHDKEGKDVIQA